MVVVAVLEVEVSAEVDSAVVEEVFEEVDAVVVATPPSSHASISIDCLNHGLHVLCEKPLATSVEEAKEVVAASKRTQAHLAGGMGRRVHWSSQLLKKLIEKDHRKHEET